MEAILNFDLAIFEFFENFIRQGWLNPIMWLITHLGDDGIFFIIIGLVMLFFKKTRKAGVICLGSLLIMTLLNNELLKPLIERPRPYNLARLPEATKEVIDYYAAKGKTVDASKYDWVGFFGRIDWTIDRFPGLAEKWNAGYVFPEVIDRMSPKSLSFPSGHTSSAFTFALALTLAVRKFFTKKTTSIVAAVAFVFAALMGISRVYVGVHYPSDVIMATFVGLVYALIGYFVISPIYDKIEAAIKNKLAKKKAK